MTIYSDYGKRTIEITEEDLDFLIERGYVFNDEEEGKYIFEDDKYWTIQQIVGNVPERKSQPRIIKKLNETGEWARGLDWLYVKENPDDDSQEANWIRRLADDLEYIIEQIKPIKMEIEDIQGFDLYQGPYAYINIEGKEFKVWTTGYNELYIEDFPIDNTSEEGLNPGFQGDKEIVIDVIKMWVDDEKKQLKIGNTIHIKEKAIQKFSDFK